MALKIHPSQPQQKTNPMKKLFPVIIAAFALAAFNAKAQQQAGDLAIQFSGNYNSQTIEFDGTRIKSYFGNVYIKLGKFFTPNLELGVKPNVFFSPEVEQNPRDPKKPKTTLKTRAGFGIYGSYSFLTADGKFMPYAGAEIGYLPVSEDATVNLGPYAGIKYFVTEKINVDANINYLINLASTYGNEFTDVSISPLFQFNIGVGVIIGKLNP
jgi:hypothetical protein